MPASLRQTFRAMAHNNAWANHRFINACHALTAAQFSAPRTGFFGSIAATLNHNLTVDLFYVDALEGGTLGPAAWAIDLPFPDIADLSREQGVVDRRLVAFCDQADFNSRIQVHRGTHLQTERADRLLLHLFEHQIHHRGQAHAMLSGTSIIPPQLDEFFSHGEAPLRAAEFAGLGWTEAAIWED